MTSFLLAPLLLLSVTNQGATVDPKARALLDEVAAAYQSLAGYSDAATLTLSTQVNGAPVDRTAEVPLTFARPNRIKLALEGVRLISDGRELTTSRDAIRRYLTRPAPAQLGIADVLVSPVGSVLVGGPIKAPSVVILTFLLDKDPIARLLENASGVTLEPAADDDGYAIVRIESPGRPTVRIAVDPETKLIRRIEQRITPEALSAATPPRFELASYSLTWTSGDISREIPPAERTTFSPPADFQPVVVATRAKPAANTAHPLVGKPAPDFEVSVVNGAGPPQKVSRTSLVGKVVVLDFWTTWCGPCREELPEIQAMAQRLAKAHPGKAVVFALSQDRTPDDGSNLRELVNKTLAEIEVDFTPLAATARVALDPDQAAGDAFGVEGYPTLVILDAKGQVQAVHVGYKPGVGEELYEQVETLLAGGSLLGDRPAPAAR